MKIPKLATTMAHQIKRVVAGKASLLQVTPRLQYSVNAYFSGSSQDAPVRKLTMLPSGPQHPCKKIHTSPNALNPLAKTIPLPENIEDIDAAEKTQFSPQRSRDISGPVILAKTMGTFANNSFATGYNARSLPSDPRLASYDCRGPISLNSVMQTNVPEPFSAKGKATHLNMPGGQWGQGHKYISDDLHNCHYVNTKGRNPGTYNRNRHFTPVVLVGKSFQLQTYVSYSTSVNNNSTSKVALTNRQKLKLAVKEYGSTVVVFHIAISLISLGGCYLAVSSGLDISSLVQSFGVGDVAAGASDFVVAYAVHKVFAPVRLSITLASTPFIVRYLRKVGVLKR